MIREESSISGSVKLAPVTIQMLWIKLIKRPLGKCDCDRWEDTKEQTLVCPNALGIEIDYLSIYYLLVN